LSSIGARLKDFALKSNYYRLGLRYLSAKAYAASSGDGLQDDRDGIYASEREGGDVPEGYLTPSTPTSLAIRVMAKGIFCHSTTRLNAMAGDAMTSGS
jgi:hypothetical protein